MEHAIVTAREADLTDGDRRDIIELCELAFREDFSHYIEHHPNATHVLVRDESGLLLSYGAFVERWLQPDGGAMLHTAYVEALATRPGNERQGLASAVLQRLVDEIRDQGVWDLAGLSPAVDEFYENRGWERWQGSLGIRMNGGIEPSPPDEELMILRLPRTPAGLDLGVPISAEWRVDELW